MPKAYVVERLWTDAMENNLSQAMGYELAGVSLDKESAEQLVRNAPEVEGTGWPIPKGKKVKLLRYTETDILEGKLIEGPVKS